MLVFQWTLGALLIYTVDIFQKNIYMLALRQNKYSSRI